MKIRDLLEEFYDSFKTQLPKRYVEVFKNPTKKEINDSALKEADKKVTWIKFIAFRNTKDVYVFSPLAHHVTVRKKSKLKGGIDGVARKFGKNFHVERKMFGDFGWLKKYGIYPRGKSFDDY